VGFGVPSLFNSTNLYGKRFAHLSHDLDVSNVREKIKMYSFLRVKPSPAALQSSTDLSTRFFALMPFIPSTGNL